MKRLLLLLCLGSVMQAADSQPCLIVTPHHHSFGENMARWTPARAYEYVEGEYPKGMKFEHEVGDKQIRKLKALGGKMVVIKAGYSPDELRAAHEQCKAAK